MRSKQSLWTCVQSPHGGPSMGAGPARRRGSSDLSGSAQHGRRGRRRIFDSGQLRFVLLLLLEAEPRHGYDLIRDLEVRTGGAYSPSPGVIYPTLTLLEDLGHVEARSGESPKKLYSITPAGLSDLEAHRPEAEAALERLDQLRRQSEAVDSGPVFRAMNNLKAVLRQRLADSSDREALFAVADLIDEAARKIERL